MNLRKGLTLLALTFIILLYTQCKKEISDPDGCEGDRVPATIIGQDLRLCACCGGWFIDLGEDTVRAFTFPDGYIMDTLPALPVEVCLEYEYYTGACDIFGDLIIINEIENR